VIRLAAVGDLHLAADSAALWARSLAPVSDLADCLLLAGDLTHSGTADEAEELARVLQGVRIPVVTVLGNHDHHSDAAHVVADRLERSGIHVLEGSAFTFEVDGARVGVAGTKGFGGGFEGACGSDFGEAEMKAFIRHSQDLAEGLEKQLARLDTDVRVALLHYAPVPATLQGERLEIYPFLGSHLLAAAVDRAGADLVVHGHAHAGRERGLTPGGVRVRNVAQPVIRRPFNVYCFDPGAPGAAGERCP
jgi:Icc-related predicted phosphoesterase